MKKHILLLIILTMIVVIFPLTALASPAELQKPAGITDKKPIDISKFGHFSETNLEQPYNVSAMDSGAVGPVGNTISMDHYNNEVGGYYNIAVFPVQSTGFYTFYSLTAYNTDIYIYSRSTKKIVDYDNRTGTPFCMWIYMTKGTTYDILFTNNDNSSPISYLMTAPATLGSAGCTMSPNGLTKDWTQAFDFKVSSSGKYSIHIDGLSDSLFGWNLISGTSYKNFKVIDYSSSYITDECYHTFSLKAGTYHLFLRLHNSSSTTAPFTISVDNNIPVITAKAGVKKVKAGSSVKTSVTAFASDATLNESSMTVTVNGGAPQVWTNGEVFGNEGSYVLSASDHFNNTTTFKFNIDLAPVVHATVDSGATELKNNDITAKQVHVAYSERFIKSKALKANGKKAAWPDTTGSGSFDLSKDGVYSITLKDKAGNSASLKFTKDGTAPVITATPVKGKALPNGGFTNKPYVTVKVSDFTSAVCSVTKDGAAFAYPSKGKFTAEGKYVIAATDKAGNTSAFTFTIDRRALSIAAQDKGGNALSSGASTNSDVTVITKGNSITPTVTKNSAGYVYPASGVFTEEGTYVVTATGYTGNTSAFTFTIDKTAPTITAQGSSGSISDNGSTNKDVTVTFGSDTAAKHATKGGTAYTYPSDGKFTEEGAYVIYADDAVGNEAVFHFTINKTGPSISAQDKDGGTVPDNGYSNKQYVTVTIGSTATVRVAKKDGKDYTYPEGGKFTEEGAYIVTATDKEGNFRLFHFTIDRTAPTITAQDKDGGTVSNNGYANKDVTVIVGTDTVAKHATKGGAAYTYPTDGKFTEEGSYLIYADDAAGNEAVFHFTIDKTGPSITAANSDGAVPNNGYSNKDVTVTTGLDAGMPSAKKDDADYTYPLGGVFTEEGVYEVSVSDDIGNTSTFTFIIDKTAPVITAKDQDGKEITNGSSVNADEVTFTVSGETRKTINGGSWGDGKVNMEGTYFVRAFDDAGNAALFAFTIDRTEPGITVKSGGSDVSMGATASADVVLSIQEANIDTIVVKEGHWTGDGHIYYKYPLSYYDDDTQIPLWDGAETLTLTNNGLYSIEVFDKAGNHNFWEFTINKP